MKQYIITEGNINYITCSDPSEAEMIPAAWIDAAWLTLHLLFKSPNMTGHYLMLINVLKKISKFTYRQPKFRSLV